MSNKPISMIQISRILQLIEQGNSLREISRITGLHRKTIKHYLTQRPLCRPAPGQDDTKGVESIAEQFSSPEVRPDEENRFNTLATYFPSFDRELSRVGVTRQLLWQEYRQKHPDGYGYTQFCEHYARHRNSLPREAVMHLEHAFGDCLQIDFAGTPLEYIDRSTGEVVKCPVLVCVLAASGYTYVQALASARGEHLFEAMNRCLEYLGGVPRNVLSDNMRQLVVKNCRYEYTFTELADQWSVHYRVNLKATRIIVLRIM